MRSAVVHESDVRIVESVAAPSRQPDATIQEARANELTTFEASAPDDETRTLAVTIIRAGTSKNGLTYSRDVLAAAIPVFEGAAAFVDHPTALDHTRAGKRSLRDLAGVYEAVHLDGDSLRATLRLYKGAQWAYDLVAEAIADRQAGRRAPDIGISADMRVRRRPSGDGHWLVEAITQAVSADLVFQPSAGGSFDRVAEDAQDDPPPDAEQEAAEREAQRELTALLERGRAELAAITEARRTAALGVLDARLAASRLPDRLRTSIRSRFADQDATPAAEVDAAIQEATDLLAELASTTVVQGAGASRPGLVPGRSPLDKMQLAVDRLFGLDLPDDARDLPRLTGIREAYVLLTGDRQFTQAVHPDDAVLEANEVTTAVIASVLANSMTKRVVKDYAAQPKWWRPLVVTTAIGDFKQQQRVHLNDFASLATVAENGAYTNLSWGDSRETYAPAKRGNLVVVTWEAIVNDDTHAVTRIPRKLAAAAVATLNEFVAGLFSQNGGAGALLTDGNPVFDALAHQGNAGVGAGFALSTQAVQAALVALLKMTNTAGKRLAVEGKYLLVPTDLYYAARTILASERVPGSNNNDVNPIHGALTPVSVPNWVDANNWYVLADPAQVEMIELGFLHGREEPELLIQDGPTQGTVFTNDAISWKIRHVFGGGFLDFRGGYGAIVP